MPNAKAHNCIYCQETQPHNFYGTRKTVCKKCLPAHIKLSPEEQKRALLKPYACKICGTTDITQFHPYCKNKCREHYNGIKKLSKTKITILKRPQTTIPILDPHAVSPKNPPLTKEFITELINHT